MSGQKVGLWVLKQCLAGRNNKNKTAMKTIGKLLPNNKVELERSGQGYIYKNFEAFKNKTNEICYIPEYGIDEENNIEQSYTYNDFLEFATEYLKNNKGCKLTPEQ